MTRLLLATVEFFFILGVGFTLQHYGFIGDLVAFLAGAALFKAILCESDVRGS